MRTEELNVSTFADYDNHERVVRCIDSDSGLHAFIAIHNRTLGPALGGCRMWPYPAEEDAIKDVLRLSRGMTYKSAISGLPLGGGKAVIIGDPDAPATTALADRARRVLLPEDAVVVAAPGSTAAAPLAASWFAGRELDGERPTATICRGQSCSLPISRPDQIAPIGIHSQ